MSNLLKQLGYMPQGGMLAPRRFALGEPLDLQAELNEQAVAEQQPGTPAPMDMNAGRMAVAKGSGLSKWEDLKQKVERSQRATQNTYMDEDQVADLYHNIDMLPEIQDAKSGIALQQKLLEREVARPQSADITGPLMGLLKAEFGRDVSGFPKPETNQRKGVLDFASKLQDDKNALAKTYLEGIGKQKTGTLQDMLLSNMMTNQGVKGQDPQGHGNGVNRAALDASRYLKDFRSDQEVKAARLAQGAGRDIQNMTRSIPKNGTWVMDSNMKALLTKAAGLYPISDRDIEAFGGDPSLEAKFNRMMSKMLDGSPLTQEDRAAIVEYGNLIEKVKNAELDQMSKTYAEDMGPVYGYDPEDAYQRVRPWRGVKEAGTKASTPPPGKKKSAKGGAGATKRTKALEDMTDAELDAYEAQLKAGRKN